jgi:putative FmdB family regulatory protein
MPTYEYECTGCGHRFEEFQSITAEPLEACPQCGRKLRRLFGNGAGVIFRGSGFHQTDYRSKEYTERAKAETAESSPSSSASDEK